MREKSVGRNGFTSDKRAAYVVVVQRGGLSEVGRETAGGDMLGTCFVCERQTTTGIAILHSFLCEACEYDMVSSRVTDGGYEFLMRRVAAFWQSMPVEATPSEGSFPGSRGIMS